MRDPEMEWFLESGMVEAGDREGSWWKLVAERGVVGVQAMFTNSVLAQVACLLCICFYCTFLSAK